MSVKYIDNTGSGALGILGSLAMLGGKLIPGAQWLTPLGLGMGAIDTAIKGETPSEKQTGGLSEVLKHISGWFNPAKGNIGKINPDEKSDEELASTWGMYNTGGYNSWQLY